MSADDNSEVQNGLGKKKTLSNLITLGTVDAHCNRLTEEEKSKTKKEKKGKRRVRLVKTR